MAFAGGALRTGLGVVKERGLVATGAEGARSAATQRNLGLVTELLKRGGRADAAANQVNTPLRRGGLQLVHDL